MVAGSRSRPFFMTLKSNGGLKDIPINDIAPVTIETDCFVGSMMMIHETGNEPTFEDEDDDQECDVQLRGVLLQIQGRFKKRIGSSDPQTGLWVCAEMQAPLKLGWFMQNVALLGVKFAKKKTNGRVHYSLGDDKEHPKLSFPAFMVFKAEVTAPGKTPPRLGSDEMSRLTYQKEGVNEVSPENIYTFSCRTPFLDLCSWDVLNVPAVSPLPLEKLIGDVTTLHLVFYDVDIPGSHAKCHEKALLEFTVRRGRADERWAEVLHDGAKTPLTEDSEDSEVSEGDELVDEGQQSDASEDSNSDMDPLEDEQTLTMEESRILLEINAWKPSVSVATAIENGCSWRIPFYIESIDRRRRWKLHVWFIFTVLEEEGRSWWHAMEVSKLATLCRCRPRTKRTFRRGTQAAAVKRYGVQTLEMFRHEVCSQLASDESDLRNTLADAACRDLAEAADQDEVDKTNLDTRAEPEIPRGKKIPKMSQFTARKIASSLKRKRTALLPPAFFKSSPACELAFSHAKEGRSEVKFEGVVGAVLFEGRISEELMRLSIDGVLRLFSPYRCDQPRLRVCKNQIVRANALEGLFLGRFFLFEIHTIVRVFTFCTSTADMRDAWVEEIKTVYENSLEVVTQPGNQLELLRDTSGAQRWREAKRLVLNDRKLLVPHGTAPQPPGLAAGLLQHILHIMPTTPHAECTCFFDATCLLKGVSFLGWTSDDLLAFWLNVYHCLLLHGLLIFGRPNSRQNLNRFYSRVSYLVGSVPISLREIEVYILRVPAFSKIALNAMTSRINMGQTKAWNAMHTATSHLNAGLSQLRSSDLNETSTQKDRALDAELEEGGEPASPAFFSRLITSMAKYFPTFNGGGGSCLPSVMPTGLKVQLPSLPWHRQRRSCLFVGWPSNMTLGLRELQKERRVTFCLNRGTLGNLGTVPVFDAVCLDQQLNDVSKAFVKENVLLSESMFGTKTISVPRNCRGLWRELKRDPRAFVKFISQFMEDEQKDLSEKVRLSFRTTQGEPRNREELKPHIFSELAIEVVCPEFNADLTLTGSHDLWQSFLVDLKRQIIMAL